MSGKAKATTKSPHTPYVVLELITGEDGRQFWAPVLDGDAEPKLRVFMALGKHQAIRAHTGDGPEVLEGTWKAVPMVSWRGGEVTKRVTAAERVAVVDE